MGKPHTIIGAEQFHYRVRDGIGWFPLAMAARRKGVDALGGLETVARALRGASVWVLYGQASRAISTG